MAQVEVILPSEDVQSSQPDFTWKQIDIDSLPKPPVFGSSGKEFTDKTVTGILQFEPYGQSFETPVVIKITHHPVLSDHAREIKVYQSENNTVWKQIENIITVKDDDDESSVTHMERTLIFIKTIPVFVAVLNQLRTEYCTIGPKGGTLTSTAIPEVQIDFEEGCLTREINVGLQVQLVPPDVTFRVIGHQKIAFSPFIIIKPFRRKFHRPIKISVPIPGRKVVFNGTPQAGPSKIEEPAHASKERPKKTSVFGKFIHMCGKKTTQFPMNMQPECATQTYEMLPESLILLSSITAEPQEPVWEDASTGVSFMKNSTNNLTFWTTVSAKFCLVHVEPGFDIDVMNAAQKIYNYISTDTSRVN